MLFSFGLIVGILLSILVVLTLTYFRYGVEKRVTIIEKTISNAGPRPRGFIVEPLDENEEVRQSVIAKNRARGKDTAISELL